MAVRTKVQRGAKPAGEDFALPAGYGDDLDADVALVGGGDDGAGQLTIDPSLANESDDDDNWDEADKGKKPAAREPERRTVEVEVEDDEDDEPGDGGREDARLAYDLDSEGREEERDSRREPSRRQRRNRSRRELNERSGQEIEQLRQQLAQMEGIVQQVTGGQAHLAINTIDGRMHAAAQSVELADDLMAKAIEAGDGKAFAQIQKQRDEAVNTLYALRNQRARIEANLRQQGTDPRMAARGGPAAPQINPALADRAREMGERFLDRNPWFDPEGVDRESRMAKMIDQELAEEGYQPHTRAFWVEFEERCREAGLGAGTQRRPRSAAADDGDEEERPARAAPARREANLPPTGVVRSARGPGKPVFTLSQFQVQTLQEEGLMEPNLSDADKARKTRIITKWREGEKALKRQSR